MIGDNGQASCFVVALKLIAQPRLHRTPFAIDRCPRDTEDLAHFFIGHATEKSKFNQLGLTRIKSRKLMERVVIPN